MAITKCLKCGDFIEFGHYTQTEEGNDKTPIKWRVLEVKDNKALVISEYGIDAKAYNEECKDTTWETSSIRSWLNNGFLNSAFNADEQAKIQSTNVSADKNPHWNTTPGNDTIDKIFLLSINEAKKYFPSDIESLCVETDYVIARRVDYYYDGHGKYICWWWLRSPGANQSCAARVNYDGSLHYCGKDVSYDLVCVRPALWINLDSLKWEKKLAVVF